mmetsp:Transcript_19406/g.47435  ORF Transcript_19406/g.47435 Transcript_19406/m.47435 type:complete len:368 (-) Transcript_19406:226-1329(-)|eukprot:CAMPEP_0114502886 /NCGR_PEP_ID=MMETSP0109-20121206/9348_1 /TAXON_ID=29199 /ORGANISM="Chlorarachnion reptans, Strain CCCM449" /LENGTH=367 /DNA_ID=CAMNT_0001680867 /DNA_START=40 /DNA_END=1143 /DNA_ORIENTATION=-
MEARHSEEKEGKGQHPPPESKKAEAAWDVQLESVRANIRKDLRRFDVLLGARQESLRRKESLLGVLVPGQPSDRKRLASSSSHNSPRDPLRRVAGSIGSAVNHAVSIAKARSVRIEEQESRLPSVEVTPMVRINLAAQLKNLKPAQIHAMLMGYILEEKKLHLPSVYGLMGTSVPPNTELKASIFIRWMENAIGDTLPSYLLRIIFEYDAQSPKGMEYQLQLSSLYPSIANTYASVVDGRHGYPGAATNRGASQFIQAVFTEDVFPTKVILSQPRFGLYAEQGWPTEGNYLHANMVIEVPKSQEEYDADSKSCRWITVGNVRSDLELANGAIEVPLNVPAGCAKVFRLWNSDRSLNTYVVTGTFEFE